MLKFKQYILNEKAGETGNINDAKGKTNEIETAKGLAAVADSHPIDYRGELERSHHINNRAHDILGDEYHSKVKDNTHAAIPHILHHLKTHYDMDLSKPQKDTKVAWTSQDGDIKAFTGKDDPGNPSDVMIRHGGKHVGISCKYGKNPGLGSPGHGALQKTLGMPKEEGDSINRMKKHLTSRVHEVLSSHIDPSLKSNDKKNQLKKYIAQDKEGLLEPHVQKSVDAAASASTAIRANMVSKYAKHFNAADPGTKEKFVRHMLNVQKTVHPMIKVHVDEKGKTTIADPHKEFENFHSHVNTDHPSGGYEAVHDHDQTAGKTPTQMHIHAHMKGHDKPVKVATMQIKHNSGLYTATGASIGAAGSSLKKFGKAPYGA
jgi:hypothetical protein